MLIQVRKTSTFGIKACSCPASLKESKFASAYHTPWFWACYQSSSFRMRCFSFLKRLTCNLLWTWEKPGLLLKRSRWGMPAGPEQRKKVQRVDGSNPYYFFLNPSLMHAVNTDVSKVSKKVCSLSASAHTDLRCSLLLPPAADNENKPKQITETQICLPNFVPREI